MFKQYFLILTLMLMPGCMRNRNVPLTSYFKKTPVVIQSQGLGNNEVAQEDLESFVLQEEYNPFTTDLLTEANTEDIELEKVDTHMGDKVKDSAQYGFQTLYFNFDSYSIKPDQKKTLAENTKIAKDLASKGYEIVVEGHACDSAGSPHYNLMLSEDRAAVVADHFADQKINSTKIHTVGRGAEMRIVPHGDRVQQAPNRRVEIYAYSGKN